MDVEDDLKLIERKYASDIDIVDVPMGIRDKISKLNNEFESIGLPKISCKSNVVVNVFNQVINNVYTLINMYRKSLKPTSSIYQNKLPRGCMDWTTFEKYESELNETKKMIVKLEENLKRFNSKYEDLDKENKALKQELCRNKKFYSENIDQCLHKIKNLQHQNESLKEKYGDNIGKHSSENDIVVKLLNKYKLNEEVFKETIDKLQETNRDLLEELVNLKYR